MNTREVSAQENFIKKLMYPGVHGIFHTASPADFTFNTFEKMVTPAVSGTENLLKSALAHAGPQLSAVVVTSSVAAVTNPPLDRDYTFDESDFATIDLDLAKANELAGISTPVRVLYNASKTASEAVVWSFRTKYKPGFTISTIHPGVVMGPPVQPPSIPEKLNATLRPLWGLLSGSVPHIPPISGSGTFVDVRDVAFMHLWAFENGEKADGERFIAVAGFGEPQAIADILREGYPDRVDKIPKGTPGAGYTGWKDGIVDSVGWTAGRIRMSGEKAQKFMGIEWIPMKRSVLDTAMAMEIYL